MASNERRKVGTMGLMARAGIGAGLCGAAVGLAWLLSALATPLTGGTPAIAAPEPDPVPRRWQLTIEPGQLRVMNVDVDGAQGPEPVRMYYYLTYKVINTSGQDLLFTPSFDLASDEGDLARSGRGVPPAATQRIVAALENPLLQDQISIVGMLLQGEENAKEGVAIWPVGTQHVRDLKIFANGFSGETRTVEAFDPATQGTKRVVLRKTLMMRFQPLGENRDTGAEGLPMIEQRWIMR